MAQRRARVEAAEAIVDATMSPASVLSALSDY
jgi:hypothetical protein